MSYSAVVTATRSLEQRTVAPCRSRHQRDRKIAEIVKGWIEPGPYIVTRTHQGSVESIIQEG